MSAVARNQVFSAVHTVGALLPVDMLLRISEGKDVTGSEPADYGVAGSRSVNDEAERHWDYLKSLWKELREELPGKPEAETPPDPTGLAVSQWLLPLFVELGFGALTSLGSDGIGSDDGTKTFAISHRWNHVPVHLTAWNTSLDKRPGGAGTVPPQSLVQECVNRTDAHLWAVLSNGRRLRLLRDSSALATASYVEFDLEAIFDGELVSEFLLLYRLLHVSRFTVADGGVPSSCRLEKWRLDAITSGTRALRQLRIGVANAVTTLGTGFIKHPDNTRLRNNVDVPTLHAALLRLVYRLLFVFVAEDREVLHAPSASAQARQRYERYFSTARLRRHARRRRGTAHGDLYQALRIVLDALADERGRPELGLPGLGGIFDRTDADAPLEGLSLSNEHMLAAVRHLAQVRDTDSGRLRAVDYQHLDAEELGSVYESLLELNPGHSATDGTFELATAAGNERKRTGSYYTPSSLIECLLDSTLDPVIEDAVKRGEQAASTVGQADPSEAIVKELLSLTVCDPACGSGHFLVAAARRIAKRVAAVREHNPEPTVDAVRHALHEVIAHCIYGVDLNPMAVELAKVSLWLEALEPGKPLSFLDAHVKCGNALIGATPALLRNGIPSKAFKPIEGDEPKYAKMLEKRNDKEREGQLGLFNPDTEVRVANTAFAEGLRQITNASTDTLTAVRRQQSAYEDFAASADYQRALHLADAWCATFLWYKKEDAPPAITDEVFRNLQDPQAEAAPQASHDEIKRLRNQYRFFHWHLEFPDIFAVAENVVDAEEEAGWTGGFSCVLGNPPWDKLDFEDKKYFSIVEPSIAELSGAARRRKIEDWAAANPEAAAKYRTARREIKGKFHFAGDSEGFPFCSKGLAVKGVNSLQIDQLFAERFAVIGAPTGRAGCIIPTAIATGAGAQHLFGDFAQRGSIRRLFDFENRQQLFDIDSRLRFCLFSIVGKQLREPEAQFAFFLQDVEDLDVLDKVFTLTPEEIVLINPNTRNLPVFRSRRDADLSLAIYRRFPILYSENREDGNPWGVSFKNLFNSTDDSDIFWDREALEADNWERNGNCYLQGKERMLPVFEGKMAHLFDHRWNRYYGTGDNDYEEVPAEVKSRRDSVATPRRWVKESGHVSTIRRGEPTSVAGASARLETENWTREWVCGWRDIARATDERTAIATFLPRVAAVETFPLMFTKTTPRLTGALIATQSSLVFDFVARQKASGAHMGRRVWKQLPTPMPRTLEPHIQFIGPRLLELVYTADEMNGLARDLADSGPPFQWDDDRRSTLRAELDAFFFHFFGVTHSDVDYILETFQSDSGGGLKNNEIAKYGRYRTKELVLAEYDRMAEVGVGLETPLVDGVNYTSTLTPPPGHGPRHPAVSEGGGDG